MTQQIESRLLPLIRERAQAFRKSFQETATEAFQSSDGRILIHSGEYGAYRERLLEALLRSFLPNYVGLGTGFVVGREGDTSTQADTILYDIEEIPKIEDPSLRRFFPIEGVLAVGEVKSTIRSSNLEKYLEKLKRIKKLTRSCPAIAIPCRPSWRVAEAVALQQALSEEYGGRPPQAVIERELSEAYDPHENHWQNKLSFVVCSSFEGGAQNLKQNLKAYSSATKSEEDAAMDHNMFLSLEDGYQSYSINGHAHPYPRGWSEKLNMNMRCGMSFIQANDDCTHIMAFVSDLCSCASDVGVYPFRVADYVQIPRELIGW